MRNDVDRNSSRGRSRPATVLTVLLVLVLLAAAVFFLIWYDKMRTSDRNTPPNTNTPSQNSNPAAATDLPVIDNPDGLIINEVKRGDDGFIEVFNNSDKSVDLGSYYLSDDQTKVERKMNEDA